MSLADQLDQILPACIVFREKRQMSCSLTAWDLLPVIYRLWGQIDLTSKNRLYSIFACSLVKFDSSVEIPMIGHRNRRHPQLCRPCCRLFATHRPIKSRILCVEVKMNKRVGHSSFGQTSIGPPAIPATPKRTGSLISLDELLR